MLEFCTRFLLNNAYKRVFGIFFTLFRSWVINKNLKNESVEPGFFRFLKITQNLSKIKKIPKRPFVDIFFTKQKIDFPCVLVGLGVPSSRLLDAAISKKVLDDGKCIFGYWLSRARRAIENVIGIWSSQFHILWKTIIDDVKNVVLITKAVASLHNYLINEIRYISGQMEEEMTGDQNLQEYFLPFRQV